MLLGYVRRQRREFCCGNHEDTTVPMTTRRGFSSPKGDLFPSACRSSWPVAVSTIRLVVSGKEKRAGYRPGSKTGNRRARSVENVGRRA